MGKFHLNNWIEIEGVEVVGFCDPDDKNATAVADKYKIKRYDTAEELFEHCDAADIVAPTTLHYELCALALRKGKHVFVEKPLTNTMEEAKYLCKLAKKYNMRFKVGHKERFNTAFYAFKYYDLNTMYI